jgi:hypothetical protein
VGVECVMKNDCGSGRVVHFSPVVLLSIQSGHRARSPMLCGTVLYSDIAVVESSLSLGVKYTKFKLMRSASWVPTQQMPGGWLPPTTVRTVDRGSHNGKCQPNAISTSSPTFSLD